MREIKYRAWIVEDDPEYSRMVDSAQSVLTIIRHKYGLPAPPSFSDCCNQPKPEKYYLMQSTGLKDKNGTEIYEGDIVEAWSEGVEAIGQVQQRKDGLWIMYPAWQSEKFWGLCPNEEKETRVTILGNIFEHPELLEVE